MPASSMESWEHNQLTLTRAFLGFGEGPGHELHVIGDVGHPPSPTILVGAYRPIRTVLSRGKK